MTTNNNSNNNNAITARGDTSLRTQSINLTLGDIMYSYGCNDTDVKRIKQSKAYCRLNTALCLMRHYPEYVTKITMREEGCGENPSSRIRELYEGIGFKYSVIDHYDKDYSGYKFEGFDVNHHPRAKNKRCYIEVEEKADVVLYKIKNCVKRGKVIPRIWRIIMLMTRGNNAMSIIMHHDSVTISQPIVNTDDSDADVKAIGD